jgi:Ni,Fe-hydrogenase maturation factor
MQAQLERILLIGCEPADLGGGDGRMGLSEPVERAVKEAVKTIETLVQQILSGGWPTAEDDNRA